MEMEAVLNRLDALKLSDKAAISLQKTEPDYVLHIDSQSCAKCGNEARLAATSSNFTVRLYSRHNITYIESIKAHEKPMTGVRFSPTDDNLLYTSSLDGTIKCWDMRDTKKPSLVYNGYEETNNIFCSFDINSDGTLLCAGTEATKLKDVYLIFWDCRSSDRMGVYSESHQDDITQVTFHPSSLNRLLSCSTDGLVNVFDLTNTSEDDALQTSFNTESSASITGWCGAEYQDVYCITHLETLHIWETATEEFNTLTDMTDLRDRFKGEQTIDYLVDCFQTSSSPKTNLLTGSSSGKLHLWTVDGDNLEPVCNLGGGHNDVVRCASWDDKLANLVTGGEDSMLCLWKSGQPKKSDKVTKLKQGGKEKERRSYSAKQKSNHKPY